MANFNFRSIEELNKVIAELIATRDVQLEAESSSGKTSNPIPSIIDTVEIEDVDDVEEVPEGDDVLIGNGRGIVHEDWVPSGLDMVVFVPGAEVEVPVSVVETENRVRSTVEMEEVPSPKAGDKLNSETPVGESSNQKGLSPVMEALQKLEEMEKIMPIQKRPLPESFDTVDSDSMDEDVEILSSRKKRKFTPAKGRSKPVRWSSRKVTSMKKEEPNPEQRTPAPQKTRARVSAAANPKEIMDELSLSKEFLIDNKLEEVFELLSFQGWVELLSVDEPVDKELVAEFFYKVSKMEMGPVVCLHFEFRGQQLMVTSRDLASELGLKHEGFDLYTKKFWPEGISEAEKVEMEQAVCNYSDPNVNELSTNDMSVTMKVLHRVLVHSLLPRKSKTAGAQIQDILVLNQILKKKQINWPKLILHHIDYISEFKEVGYAKLVKRILKLSYVYEPTVEVSVQRPLTTNSIHRWGFEFVDQIGWVKKDHKTQAEEGAPSKVSEKSELIQIKESLARLEKNSEAQKKEIAELKKMIREGFKGKKKA